MKFICKKEEPASFTHWKQLSGPDWQPNWENFQKPEKVETHESLLIEQGYICCYCEQRITREDSHIEHFQPRTSFPEFTLSYGNFLASCPGYLEEAEFGNFFPLRSQEFCGQQKGAWYDPQLTVSPLHPDCATYFRYTGTGMILPSTDPMKVNAATATIEHLALDHPKLNRGRERAIDAILSDIETLSPDEIRQFIKGLSTVDRDGKYVPFCSAVIYILEEFQG